MNQISGISRPKFLPDNFTLALIGTLVLASLLPCRGAALEAVDHLTNGAIAALFFLHGAQVSRQAVIAGASHWRLHAPSDVKNVAGAMKQTTLPRIPGRDFAGNRARPPWRTRECA